MYGSPVTRANSLPPAPARQFAWKQSLRPDSFARTRCYKYLLAASETREAEPLAHHRHRHLRHRSCSEGNSGPLRHPKVARSHRTKAAAEAPKPSPPQRRRSLPHPPRHRRRLQSDNVDTLARPRSRDRQQQGGVGVGGQHRTGAPPDCMLGPQSLGPLLIASRLPCPRRQGFPRSPSWSVLPAPHPA